jgi:hypothetical protein
VKDRGVPSFKKLGVFFVRTAVYMIPGFSTVHLTRTLLSILILGKFWIQFDLSLGKQSFDKPHFHPAGKQKLSPLLGCPNSFCYLKLNNRQSSIHEFLASDIRRVCQYNHLPNLSRQLLQLIAGFQLAQIERKVLIPRQFYLLL